MEEREMNNNEVTTEVSGEEEMNLENTSKPSKGFLVKVLGAGAAIIGTVMLAKHFKKKNKKTQQEEENLEDDLEVEDWDDELEPFEDVQTEVSEDSSEK